MASVDQAMQTLTAQWYNAMVTGLGLSNLQFQLYQGPNSMVTTSQQMWNMFNAVPPTAVNSYYDPNQANNFAPDYNNILVALVATSDTNFQTCMGDYYGQWQTYFQTHQPKTWDAQGISDLFNQWAMMFAPSKSGCVTALTKAFINPINTAINMFAGAAGSFAWNQTIDAMQAALAGGATKSFSMDSSTQSSDISHTWAGGGTSVFFDVFSFGASASYDSLSVKATSAGLNIKASFKKVTTFASGPYAQKDPNNPVLANYNPWYYSAALATAYTHPNDNTVWNNQSPTTWDSAFGPGGFMQRMATALVVADGIDITMTSTATYSSSEQTQIVAAAKAGFWPFFSASGSGGTTTVVTFNDAGQFTSTTSIAPGNPQVLGMLQSPMSSIF